MYDRIVSRVAHRVAGDTFDCPDCGTSVLENTGYCVKCKKKVKKASVRKADSGDKAMYFNIYDFAKLSNGSRMFSREQVMLLEDILEDIQMQLYPKVTAEIKKRLKRFERKLESEGLELK